MIVYLGLGSNLGDRLKTLKDALYELKAHGLKVHQVSCIYKSKALVPHDAPQSWDLPFLNLVVKCETQKEPGELLNLCQKIERHLGRKPSKKWAPRVIDIDILIYGNKKINEEGLVIPHPEIVKREFVLNPLAQVAPCLLIPGYHQSVLQLTRQSLFHQCLIMGILNITPDSFSDGGTYNNLTTFHQTVKEWIQEGVEIIDVGAESTRPGAAALDPKEEWRRLEPALETLLSYSHLKVSVDTYHPQTAQKCIEKGVHIINDVSGLHQPEMLTLASKHDVDFVAMHNMGLPPSQEITIPLDLDPVDEIRKWLEKKIKLWETFHIDLNRVIFDPGIGFGKTAKQSLQVLNQIEKIFGYDLRILIGHSRKSFMDLFTDRNFSERDPETLGLSLKLNVRGVDILRVHDAGTHIRALKAFRQIDQRSK